MHVKNKKITKNGKLEVDVVGVGPTRLLKLHVTTRDALAHFVTKQEVENLRLKREICELKEALSPKALLMPPLIV